MCVEDVVVPTFSEESVLEDRVVSSVVLNGEVVLEGPPLGCQPGGQRGLQRADAIVGHVDVGDFFPVLSDRKIGSFGDVLRGDLLLRGDLDRSLHLLEGLL